MIIIKLICNKCRKKEEVILKQDRGIKPQVVDFSICYLCSGTNYEFYNAVCYCKKCANIIRKELNEVLS